MNCLNLSHLFHENYLNTHFKTVRGLMKEVFHGSVFYLRDLLTLTVASKLSATFLLGQEL